MIFLNFSSQLTDELENLADWEADLFASLKSSKTPQNSMEKSRTFEQEIWIWILAHISDRKLWKFVEIRPENHPRLTLRFWFFLLRLDFSQPKGAPDAKMEDLIENFQLVINEGVNFLKMRFFASLQWWNYWSRSWYKRSDSPFLRRMFATRPTLWWKCAEKVFGQTRHKFCKISLHFFGNFCEKLCIYYSGFGPYFQTTGTL